MTQATTPLISVIMPVYNAEKYLNEAIDSILDQTVADFEFIIVNDGSSDKSEQIILAYKDPRIVYVKNQVNLGLIGTLNNAIQLAKGKFIARMDNDDISFPERFEKQLAYMEKHPEAKVVCSPIICMTSEGKETESWPADIEARTPQQIVSILPWENCIAHPTILIETGLLKKYGFSVNQKGSEDWDLWLRLVRDKVVIVKTPEVLLKYRIHNTSFTQVYNSAVAPQIKATGVKIRFALNSLKQFRLNFFVIKTLLTSYKDLGYYVKSKVLPRKLKQLKWLITINPFSAYKQYRLLKAALEKKDSDHFLFFPYAHIGGAEKVHAEITKVAEDESPFVFFTGLKKHTDYTEQFGNKATLLKVARALYHPLFSKRSGKIILEKIHASVNPVVFGCNNLFFYDLLLKLRKDVYVADLTHDYDYVRDKKFAETYLRNYLRCDARVFISNATLKRTLDFYEANKVDKEFVNRISLIYNYVKEPFKAVTRSQSQPYKILYVGRDTSEKRVDIVVELAARCEKEKLPFEFILVGPVAERPAYKHLKNLKLEGTILDEARLSTIYGASHFVIISSVSEGFPLTIMEGMIHGCIPFSTAVGDIPFHIENEVTGFLVREVNPPDVVNSMLNVLLRIRNGEFDLESISRRSAAYAHEHFDKNTFVQAYKKILRLQ